MESCCSTKRAEVTRSPTRTRRGGIMVLSHSLFSRLLLGQCSSKPPRRQVGQLLPLVTIPTITDRGPSCPIGKCCSVRVVALGPKLQPGNSQYGGEGITFSFTCSPRLFWICTNLKTQTKCSGLAWLSGPSALPAQRLFGAA